MRLSPTLAASTAFFFALGYPIGASAVHAATPGLVLVARFGLSAVILAVIAIVRGLSWPRGRQLGHAAVVGFLSQGLQFVGCYEAMSQGVSPVLVALVIAMNPVVTAVAASLVLGERLTVRRAVSVFLAVVAVATAFAGRVVEVGHLDLAVVWVVVAVLGLALGGVYQQRHLTTGDPIAINAVGVTVALIPAGIFALVTEQHVADPRQAVISIAGLVIANSVIAASLYLAAIKQAGASAVSLLFGVIPSIAALLTWGILGERPDVGVVIGLAVGALACFIGNSRSARGAVTPSPEPVAPRMDSPEVVTCSGPAQVRTTAATRGD
ncbi:DMT family transporter [Gordonia sp. ABSL1-1]|uniref:DMT family transporter n=1 Tax=Gordonia sp. ABSL1-1 TaxID=3053923 RepID=UPI0025731B06|nr:DMT family transporter [Gordonia sp. ABSL1-1]MDL9935793.1 DMT family transporter [Gordonia sp. ABSL1-1]